MAVSPVVAVTAQELPRPVSSPLKSALASGQTSSDGTPRPAPAAASSSAAAAAAAATLPPTLDLAEQMNEEEKRKYAKGR